MAEVQDSDVFLVGSVPLGSADEVFAVCGEIFGDRVFALPDGELDARRMWIGGLNSTTFSAHPDLELDPDHPPYPEESPFDLYRPKPKVERVSLKGRLPYADAALDSYRVFSKSRDAGVIAPGVRFQVSLPTPHAAIGAYFANVERDWPMMQQAYQEAIMDEIARILEVVPAAELAIQWDYATELGDIVGAATGRREADDVWPWQPAGSADEKVQIHTANSYIQPLTEPIPEHTVVGFHLCLGTYPKQPVAFTEDLGEVVRVANTLVEATPRRVDFFHLPGLDTADSAFFAPLVDLDIGDARVFLGIECGDGKDALLRRAKQARKFLPSFGISHFCGYGREAEGRVPEFLTVLREVADELD